MIAFIGVRRGIMDLLYSILSHEKKAKAAAAAPDIVDQRLPSGCVAR
jgi:hypothetical protein